jgi:lysosomal acid lipase/cholesteryl ester hydrolase
MYDDDVHPPLSLSTSSKYTKVAKYPTRNIRTPIVLVYGGSDSLVDIRVMLRELPNQTVATEIPHYEHLDFLWARDVDSQVFKHIFDALESFTGPEHTKEEYERYRSARHTSLSASREASFRRRAVHNSDTVESDVSGAMRNDDGTPPGRRHGHDSEAKSAALPRRPLHQNGESQIPTSGGGNSVPGPHASQGLASDDESYLSSPLPSSVIRHRPAGSGVGTGLDGADDRMPAAPLASQRSEDGGSHSGVNATRNGRAINSEPARLPPVGGVTTTGAVVGPVRNSPAIRNGRYDSRVCSPENSHSLTT